jgi:hypothetical protein
MKIFGMQHIDNLSFGNMGDLDKETEELSQVAV